MRMLLIAGFAIGLLGCAEKEQAAPEAAVEPEQAAPADAVETVVEEVVAEEPGAEDAVDQTLAVVEDWRDEDLLDHMHAHAEHLDDLNYALDDGDLEAAKAAANWIVNHKTVSGLPANLQAYVDGMRDAAGLVGEAGDIDAARAAAGQIGAQCQACHAASDVVVQ